jgi:hypothetical protein
MLIPKSINFTPSLTNLSLKMEKRPNARRTLFATVVVYVYGTALLAGEARGIAFVDGKGDEGFVEGVGEG